HPDERRGDLRAQLAAHRLAERRLAELVARRGEEAVAGAMEQLYRYSERVVRAAIGRLPDGRYEAAEVLEPIEGTLELRVAVTIAGDAIVAGNTETSSRIVDAVFAALGRALPVPAQGQGTMNNVTFGGRGFTYYET